MVACLLLELIHASNYVKQRLAQKEDPSQPITQDWLGSRQSEDAVQLSVGMMAVNVTHTLHSEPTSAQHVQLAD